MKGKLRAGKPVTADRVLILEGVSASSKELASCLTKVGFEVARIPNNPYTLMTLHVFKPDIVIVDETVADGFEVCKQMRNAVGVPVLLAGEEPGTDILTRALIETGADFYLRKPFDREVWATQISAILSRYRKTSAGSIQDQNQER